MIHCVIIANNRPHYLIQVEESLTRFHPEIAPRLYDDTDHVGMAANIARAWTDALTHEWDYLLHLEDDMVLLAPLPLQEARGVLHRHPHIANMIFQRQAWNDTEHTHGGVHGAIAHLAPHYTLHARWGEHDHIFSLNPCLIPRTIVEMGYPEGNEAEMTTQLIAAGYTFGVWGQPADAHLIEHIGVKRGPEWKL